MVDTMQKAFDTTPKPFMWRLCHQIDQCNANAIHATSLLSMWHQWHPSISRAFQRLYTLWYFINPMSKYLRVTLFGDYFGIVITSSTSRCRRRRLCHQPRHARQGRHYIITLNLSPRRFSSGRRPNGGFNWLRLRRVFDFRPSSH